MLYLTYSQVPELSGFNRKQRRFLLIAAVALQNRDDPWFRSFLALLFGGWIGFATSLCANLTFHTMGLQFWLVTATMAVAFGGSGGLLYGHLAMSHLRPFLREAILNHGAELEDIG